MFKNIVAILLVLITLAGNATAATGCELVRVYGCEEDVIDLMANEPCGITEFIGLDYRGNIIEEDGDLYVLIYGEKIARLDISDDGILVITPINRGKVTIYYNVATDSGKIYTRYVNLGVTSDCPQETCDYEEYVAPGASCYVSMTTPLVIGESINANIHTDGNGDFTTIITYGGIDNNGDVWNGVYPVVVELWEDDGNGLGLQLNASATLDCE